jgi:hypothetical protein
VKRYKSTTILGGGPPGKIVQCQSFKPFLQAYFIKFKVKYDYEYLTYHSILYHPLFHPSSFRAIRQIDNSLSKKYDLATTLCV